MFATGICNRYGDEAEIVGGVVGAEKEEAVAVVGVVLLVVDAGSDEGEGDLGRGGGEEAALVGGVRAGFNEQVGAVAGASAAEVEAFVWLFEDDDGGGGGADGVAE